MKDPLVGYPRTSKKSLFSVHLNLNIMCKSAHQNIMAWLGMV